MSRTRTLFAKARHAIEHGLIRPTYRQARFRLAVPYRALLLRRVIFIVVTGSCGKTTAKDLVTAVLSSQFKVRKNLGTINTQERIAKTLLRVRPWDKFCVQELAASSMEECLKLLRPQVGVVTNVGTDHISAFRTVEAIAAEKGKLIEALPPQHGIGILNADDANVLAMQSRCGGRIITYGLASEATLRAEDVRCSWPERLSFRVVYDGQAYAVQTQLCGRHWVSCVLAALAVGVAMGVPLATAVQAVQTVPPVGRRMSPLSLDGITIIRDDWKAPLWSFPVTLEFMREAKAKRKIVVIGTISDYIGGASATKYATVAKQCLDVADLVIFVGPKSSKCTKAKNHPRGDALLAFPSVEGARDYLGAALQPGDLVLLKGSNVDSLGELCAVELGRPPPRSSELKASPLDAVEPQTSRAPGTTVSVSTEDEAGERRRSQPAGIVVGLGNPERAYRDTPHNVGHRVLERLADSLGGEWERRSEALVATVEWKGTSLHLVKPMTPVNSSGPVLLRLCQEIGLGPADCLLVQDDMDLPLGTIRMRQRGSSDGGHKGVRSLIQALGTHRLARVKVGVGRPQQETTASGHVLKPFSPQELVAVDAACAKAADSALELIHRLQLEASRVTNPPSAAAGCHLSLLAVSPRP